MTERRRREKARQRRRSAPEPRSDQIRRIRPPKARIKPVLDIVSQVCIAGQNTLLDLPVPQPAAVVLSVKFDIALLDRGMNAAKAARLLCGEGFWEVGASAVRQLFDLVLTAEHIARAESREDAIKHYVEFGLLQQVLRERADLEYQAASGRNVDEAQIAQLDDLLKRGFQRLRTPKGKWQQNWTGLTTRTLAERSSNRLRVKQYELLYSDWSVETHAAPEAVLRTMFVTEEQFDAVAESDDVRCAELISSGVNLLIELWQTLADIPDPDPHDVANWLDTLLRWAERHGGLHAE